MIKKFLAVGQIVGTHGVRGERRVNPWADSPEFLKQFKTLYYDAEGKNSVGVISARPHGNIVLMKLEGIDTVEAASAMRNKRLYMRDATDTRYGKISDVSETGANDVWHIAADSEKEYLIPEIPSVVINTDVKENKVLIRPMKGIFDDEN